jgi:ubiquitin conjugation factor E4 B
MLPELVGRVASMLNYFLAQLVGPKCSNLKVKEPEKYLFQPKKLLLNIATIFTHFAPFDAFGQAVVRDERSYSPGNMSKAGRVLSSGVQPTMSQAGLLALGAFRAKCVELKTAGEEEEEELGEVPDEMLDPITMEIMVDPVRLPSGTLIDRPTICRHLLSDETDPFTRQRLTVEMLVPDEEMKAKIAQFRRSRKAVAVKGGSAEPADMEVG